MTTNPKYTSLHEWREKYIPQRNFILILSFIIGILTALAGVILKLAIHWIQSLLTNRFPTEEVNYWYLLFPAIGITLSYLFVRYVVKDDISHGVTRILYAISQRKSIIKLHNVWTSIVGSAVTIGFGGSVGAESPIVLTGSAIGSNLGNFFKQDQKTMMLLLGCGAAGAVSGIFKAPIAGVVFTLEVLMLDMTMTSIIPLLISSVTAASLAYLLTGSSFMFQFSVYESFQVSTIPQLIVLGIVCGLISLYFTRGMTHLEKFYRNIKRPEQKLIIGAISLGVLIFLFPPLYGEGYETIEALLNGNANVALERSFVASYGGNVWVLVAYLSLIVVFKMFAATATTSPGGVGGLFAPSLFVGCLTGFIVATMMGQFGITAPVSNFALGGMSGVMSGVMHAPLTGIFLIAELTGGYHLFMPLMIVSTTSFITIRMFQRHNIYAVRLAQKGELITHHKDKAVLTLLKMENVIETDLTELDPKMSLGELVRIISQSKRNIFPVVNPDTRKFLGVLLLDEVRNIMFQPDYYDRYTVGQLMIAPPATVNYEMPMEKVMQVFEDSGAWNLPVVDDQKRYIGFVSKSKIFNSYRHVLVHFSNE